MNPKWLPCLATILLLTSSMALANSSAAQRNSLLHANIFAAASPSPMTTINQENIFNLTNTGGTITFNPTTQTLTLTSTITQISSGAKIFTGDFGTITFTTGALMSGSILGYATFAGGGSFSITTNGTDGLPNGTFYSSTLLDTVKWHEIGTTDTYFLSAFTGIGNTHEYSTFAGGNTFNVNQGATVIPEPSTLALFATGVFGLMGAARKKLGRFTS
jgi:hypothetical protein